MTVADATPLIALARIRAFSLLQDVFQQLVIPPAVYREVVTQGKGRPGDPEVRAGLDAGWITQATPTNRLSAPYGGMHEGESEALSLAKELGYQVVIDEQRRSLRTDPRCGERVRPVQWDDPINYRNGDGSAELTRPMTIDGWGQDSPACSFSSAQ